MARKLIVEVIADAAKFIAGMEMSSKAVNGFSADVQKVSVSTELAAKAQVEAAIKTTESLKAESIAYHQLAASAVKGSQEQIAAANLAAAADTKLAASMGVAAAESKRLGGASVGATRELGRVGRGALSGTGLMHGFGRSLVFASGGFLAFEGASRFLSDSVRAAIDATVAQKSLGAQLKASGQNLGLWRGQIDHASIGLAKFGFNSDEAEKALTVLVRGTGDVRKALQLEQVTADIARAKNIDLGSAANVVAKVFGGQETALRRAVPGLSKTAHGWDLIREAQSKVRGQAAANTTVAEKFNATLYDTERIIGSALLPTLNKYVGSLTHWLNKENESGNLQRQVKRAVDDLAGAIRKITGVVHDVVGALGGWHNTLVVLGGAFLGFKAIGVSSAIAVSTANIIAAGITEKAWQAALISTGWGLFAVAAGVAAAEVIAHWSTVKEWFAEFWLWLETTADQTLKAIVEPFSHLPGGLGKWARDMKDALSADIGVLADQAAKVAQQADNASNAVKKAKTATAGSGAPSSRLFIPFDVSGGPRIDPNAATKLATQRNTWFDNMVNRQLGRVQDITSLRGQIARLRVISGEISNRITATKDITRKLNLEDQILSIQRTIRGDQAQIAQNAKDAKKVAAQKRQDAQQALLDQLQFNVDKTELTKGQQDNLKALQAEQAGIEKQIATDGSTLALQKQLLAVELAINAKNKEIADARKARVDAAFQSKLEWAQVAVDRAGLTDTLTDDLKAYNKQLAIINQQIKAQGDTAAAEETKIGILKNIKDAKTQQAQQADQATAAADQATQSTRRLFKHLNATAFVNQFGAGLTREQKRRLEIGLAMTGPGGTLPAGHSGQFTAGITINGGVHMHGVQDVAGLENQIAKRAKARPFVRRGARG